MARRLDRGRIVRLMTDGQSEPAEGSFARVIRREPTGAAWPDETYAVEVAPMTTTNMGDRFSGWSLKAGDCPGRFLYASRHRMMPTRLLVEDGRTFVRKFRGREIVGESLGRVTL